MKSFRGIGDLTLEFDPDEPTVLIGVNGVGKSSILECLAILLSWLTGQIQNPNGSGRLFSEGDIKQEHKETHNEIAISLDSWEVSWSLTLVKGEKSSSDLSQLKEVVNHIHEQLEANPFTALPLVVYYLTNRAVLDIPLRIRTKHSFQQRAAYDDAVTGEKIDFRRFFEWFRNREDLENELRLNNSNDYRDRQLEAVRIAVVQMLDGFSNLRVRRSPLGMTVEKQGQELLVNQLSDGEKCLLALIGDLARRLAIVNPDPSSNPLDGEGVILIDEIELHLHPKWQRMIIPNLKKTFPNCQFIVTTHSPQVIGHVKWVHLLQVTPEGAIVEKIPSYGKDSNRILETLLGTQERPQEIEEDIQELFRLIDRGKLEEARLLRQQLAEKMGEEDPKFVKADVLIRRKEILNR